MRARLFGTAVVVIALAAAVAACGDDDASVVPGAPTTAPPPALDGRTFIASSVTEDGAPRDLVPGTEVRIMFRDGSIGASAGCNSLGAPYRIDGTVLRVESMATTEIGCDEARHEQDAWLAEFLTSGPEVALTGDSLTLEHDATRIVLLDREVADPDHPLEGTTWVLDTVFEGDTASSVPTDEQLTLTIADEVLTAASPCNELSSTIDVEGGQLVTTGISRTDVKCPTADLRALEEHIFATLTGSIDYEIEADVLTLTNGSLGLGYRAAAE